MVDWTPAPVSSHEIGFGNFIGNFWWVSSCAWSPDGKRILSASYDKTLRMWDVDSNLLIWSREEQAGGVTCCAWSPNGKYIMSGSINGTLRCWSAETGESIWDILVQSGRVTHCAWSPDSKRVLSVSSDHILELWNIELGLKIWEFFEHADRVSSCAWSPDGEKVLATYLDGSFRIWDAYNGDLLWEFFAHEASVTYCDWSPDGKFIVSASWDSTLKVFDANEGLELAILKGHTDRVSSCAWSPDGKLILSASHDGTLKIWEPTGKEIRTLKGHSGWVNSCAWSPPDGKRILSCSVGGTLRVWDSDTGGTIKEYTASKERVVNTGFSCWNQAEKALDPSVSLTPDHLYYFWFEVGPPVPGSIEEKPEPLETEFLPSNAQLKVVLFEYKNEIAIISGKEIGKIRVMPDGRVRVIGQVVKPENISSASELLRRRLFFPVHTPDKEGVFRLRCNIYYEQILVRSSLIEVNVKRDPKPSTKPVLKTTIEYSISKSINPNYLVRMKPQKLSLMLNDNKDGTHCFRIFGEDDYKRNASFNALELKNLIDDARGALRYASWNDEKPWTRNKHYQYTKKDMTRLKDDLVRFSIEGRKFYYGLMLKIADNGMSEINEMKKLTLLPTIIEFVIKDKAEAANYTFPTSLIYDYPLDRHLTPEKFELCSSFLEALEDVNPLEDTECFNGDCPSRDDDSVVCPSGFWGFRHSIGMPLGSASEINHEMIYQQAPELTVAAYTSFDQWPSHQHSLEKIRPVIWNLSETRSDTLTMLKEKKPHVIYFYCHGGIKRGIPEIKVGRKGEVGIDPIDLLDKNICWNQPQPLIFINGCHTTALEPKTTINFVSGFIKTHKAAGVIGTEITIFEQLARVFAEECLHRFLVDGKPIGDAVRETRLKLLKEGNPLGLVYNIYANVSLRLKKAS